MLVRGFHLPEDANWTGFSTWFQAEHEAILKQHSPNRRQRISGRQAKSFYDGIADVLNEVPYVGHLVDHLSSVFVASFHAGNGDTAYTDHLWLAPSGPRLSRRRIFRQHWPVDGVRIHLPKDCPEANDLIERGWEFQEIKQGDAITRQTTSAWWRWDLSGKLFNDDYHG